MSMARLLDMIEKGHYPFKAYPKGPCRSVLFPGCSLMSQFPRTTDALADLCRALGMGVVYDCCATSVRSYGGEALADRAMARMRESLKGIGCDEVVLACPNCFAHMSRHLGIRCISIYEKLLQVAEGPDARLLEALLPKGADKARGVLFRPCPERPAGAWESQARMLMDLGDVRTLQGVPCCGLRPDIASMGGAAVRKLDESIFAKAAGEAVYTTCASCAGQFARMGYPGRVRHVLGVFLGVDEEPDAAHALINRARRKFETRLEPCAGGR